MQAAPATAVAEPQPEVMGRTHPARDRRPLVLWLLAGALLMTGLGGRPVQRTQEARVLEVARQMLGKPLDRWMVPRVNDRLRLRKPPLAYWAAAAAYAVGGVSEAVGRVPTALAGWLTLAGTYAAGAWLFGRRVGLLSAGALLSSYLFFWHSRLAETDAWSALFVTVGTLAFWKAVAPETFEPAGPSGPHRPAAWFHLGAMCTALAFLSKFGPAVFPVVFLVLSALVRRRPAALWAFVRCGAVLTLVIPPALWLGYASRHAGLEQIGQEFSNNWRGEGHRAPFYSYFYLLPIAALPWSGVLVLAIVHAARGWRRDARLQGLLLWGASVMAPLFVTGNKQPHYLLMVMPCAMVLVGWALDQALNTLDRRGGIGAETAIDPASVRFTGAVAGVFWVGVWACAAAAVAAPFAARNLRGTVRSSDVAVAGGLLAAMAAVAWVGRGHRLAHALAMFAAAWAVALTVANAWWWPSVEPNDPRTVAREFRRVAGDGPFCSYGTVAYLPLCFALREEVPAVFTPEELRAHAAANPDTHFIIRRRARDARPLLHPTYVRALEVRNGDTVFELYKPAAPSP